MKTKSSLLKGSLLALFSALFIFAGTSVSSADPYHQHNSKNHNYNHSAWSHDHGGYWDNHNSYHTYTTYHNHHGYWRPNQSGVLFFIYID